jgi:Rrf2 family cysteine metabolism transcriptional repressor
MIRLSTKVRYGVRAMIDLASHNGGEPIFLNSIARQEGISRNYLDALFSSLRTARLVRSVRGASGGYLLGKDAADINVLDIVTALEGKPVFVDCLESEGLCDRSGICPTRDLWMKARQGLEKTLSETTLQDLVRISKEKQKTNKDMYTI